MFEKRMHQRLPLELSVCLKLQDGKILQCKTKNISFGGMLLDSVDDFDMDPGCRVDCVLSLPKKRTGLDIDFECQGRHINANGIGLQFESMDFINYNHFKWLMIQNHPEPDKLVDELIENPGFLHKELLF